MTSRTLGRVISCLALGLSSSLVATTATAAEPTAAEIAVARRLFSEAAELETQERWAEAVPKLREALSVKETPGLRYHLGFCLEKQGLLVEALVEYDRADEMLRLGTQAPDVRELVGPARDGVRRRVARLTLSLAGGIEGARIELDGNEVKPALFGQPLPQNPGKHVVTASAPGRQAFRRELRLDESEARDVNITLPALAATGAPASGAMAVAPASATPDSGVVSGASARTPVLLAEVAFTALALGGGIYFTLAKNGDQDDIDAAQAEVDGASGGGKDACVNPPSGAEKACRALPGLVSDRDDHRTFATIAFVGAGVGAAATLATFLLWKPEPSDQRALRVAPVLAHRGVGLSAFGSF